jgi:hypothetical protein
MSTQKSVKLNDNHKSESQAASVGQSERGLLQYYLDLPPVERSNQFAEVSRAALLTGISARTIQRWAKHHRIRAIFVAERYQIEINSLIRYIERRAWDRGIWLQHIAIGRHVRHTRRARHVFYVIRVVRDMSAKYGRQNHPSLLLSSP